MLWFAKKMRQEIQSKIRQIVPEWKFSDYVKSKRQELLGLWGMSESEADEVLSKIDEKSINLNTQHIVLEGFDITDDEIEEIASMIVKEKPLTHSLFLSNNRLTDKGMPILCKILKDLKNMRHLDLSGNELDADGFFHVFSLFAHFDQHLRLSLGFNKLQEVGKVERIKHKAIACFKNNQ